MLTLPQVPQATATKHKHTMSSTQTMKAVNYEGPFKVAVQDVEIPRIDHPDDVIVKVTTSGESSRCPDDVFLAVG